MDPPRCRHRRSVREWNWCVVVCVLSQYLPDLLPIPLSDICRKDGNRFLILGRRPQPPPADMPASIGRIPGI
jgi:hypothetical protein